MSQSLYQLASPTLPAGLLFRLLAVDHLREPEREALFPHPLRAAHQDDLRQPTL
jgi:hypothetical protein